jgi:hypothetical protein
MPTRERIQDIRTVPASSIRANPLNARVHTAAQRTVMEDALTEIGNVDVLKVVAIPDTGEYLLVDGHLRTELRHDEDVMVAVLDLDDTEVAKVLATFDPIGALADTDRDKLKALSNLSAIQSENLATLIQALAARPADPESEWQGMPAYSQDNLMPWKTVKVHFENEDDLKAFAALVAQPLTTQTRYIWHPRQEITPMSGAVQYGSDTDES